MESQVGAAGHRVPVYQRLYVQVLAAVVAGALVGYLFPAFGAGLKPLGDAFVNIVKMIIAPVIFLTVVLGLGRLKNRGEVGTVFLKAIGYFLVVSTSALVLGLLVGNVVQPGAGMHVAAASLDASKVADYAAKSHDLTVVGYLMAIIPKTWFSALVDGDILQILFIAVVTGLAISSVGAKAEPVLSFLEAANKVVFRMVEMLMRLAPIGAFAAMAFTIGKFGLGALVSLGALIATFYGTALLFVLVILGAISRWCGFSILKLIRYLKEELLIILGTSSSEAALPSLMEKLQVAGCKRDVVGLVVPAGYSFNLDGTNIYMTLAALFIAQALDVHLSLGQQVMLVLVAMISSKGAAGVTGSGFIVLASTLSIVPDIPVAGMALILGIDRFMSECRALTNLMGNAVATIFVAKWENALDPVQLKQALDGKSSV